MTDGSARRRARGQRAARIRAGRRDWPSRCRAHTPRVRAHGVADPDVCAGRARGARPSYPCTRRDAAGARHAPARLLPGVRANVFCRYGRRCRRALGSARGVHSCRLLTATRGPKLCCRRAAGSRALQPSRACRAGAVPRALARASQPSSDLSTLELVRFDRAAAAAAAAAGPAAVRRRPDALAGDRVRRPCPSRCRLLRLASSTLPARAPLRARLPVDRPTRESTAGL